MGFRELASLRRKFKNRSQQFAADDFALVLGRRKHGKSIWAIDNVFLQSERHTIIIDPTRRLRRKYKELRGFAPSAMTPRQYIRVAHSLYRARLPVIIQPNTEHDFTFILNAAQAIGDLDLYIDEAQMLCTSYNVHPSLLYIIRLGRHIGRKGICLVMIARRPFELNPEARSNVDWLILFRMTEPCDLDWVKSKTDQGTVNQVKSLPKWKPAIVEV